MNEYKIHKLLCELIEAWEECLSETVDPLPYYKSYVRSTVSPEECLENVLRYNNDLGGRKRGISEVAVKQLVEDNKCNNPDKFLSKYEFLKAKKLDVLGPFMNLLLQLKDDRKIREILRLKNRKENKELNLNNVPYAIQSSRGNASNLKEEDVPQVCSKLIKVAAQLQGRKSRLKKSDVSKMSQSSFSDFTNWSSTRLHMSMDFIDEPNISPAAPICNEIYVLE